MSTLHNSMLKALGDIAQRLVVRLVEQKVKEQGVRLSRRQLKSLTENLVAGDGDHVVLRTWRFWERDRDLTLSISPTDLTSLDRNLEAILQAIEPAVQNAIRETAPRILQTLERRWPKESRRQRKEEESFCRRLSKTWGPPLESLARLLTICREAGQDLNERLRRQGSPDQRYTVDVLTRLHARACQIADEILTLLRSGFADGAMARWRSLYEISVVAMFIADHGESAAERYAAYTIVESYWAAREYGIHGSKLGVQPLDKKGLESIEKDYQNVLQKYGENFAKDYGWALPFFKGKPRKAGSFTDVEASVDHLHWGPYYRMASRNVHPSPKGAYFPLGLPKHASALIAGRSSVGIADPGQNAAISLTMITVTLLTQVEPTVDEVMVATVANQLCEQVSNEFVNISNRVEQ